MKKNIKNSKAYQGFSFAEILVVLAIVVSFGAAAVIGGNAVISNGRYNAARAGAATLRMGISQYHFETGAYPATLETLTVKNGSYGPWVDSDSLLDPWGNAYVYSYDSSKNIFSVYSKGSSGKENIH